VKVVITGGTGFIGLRLARVLLDRGRVVGAGGLEEEIDSIVLFDAQRPEQLPAPLDGRVEIVAGDIADRDTVAALVDRDDCSVFHLASVVSAGAERDFDLALRVNLTGGLNVLEACRARTSTPRLVLTSTYAGFGGEWLPETVSDLTKLTPETTYGTTKVILELLINDYTRKGFLDGRSARLPTVIIRPGKPNLAASSWVSAVFREPLAGKECVLPVGLELRHPLAGVRTIVEGLVRLHDADPGVLGHDRAVTLPSISVTAGEMVECVQRVGAGRPLGPIVVRPDPLIEAICGSWAKRASFDRALALGIPADESLDAIVQAYVEDELA
jgi:nucleoside-diphosphate-sugar epimerase